MSVAAVQLAFPNDDGSAWIPARDGDPSVRALFDRHYSRIHYADGRTPKLFVGPGDKMVLRTAAGDAIFVWRKFISRDDQDGVNCAVFRNEGPVLSSDLIREAEQLAWERWPGERLFTYVNPAKVRSTTIRRCINYAKRWELGGLQMLNLFAVRATDPKAMLAADDPVGPDNKDAFDEVLERGNDRPLPLVLCAWGVHGSHMDQDEHVLGWLGWPDITPMCLDLTKGEMPRHPLYMRKDVEPVPYRGRSG